MTRLYNLLLLTLSATTMLMTGCGHVSTINNTQPQAKTPITHEIEQSLKIPVIQNVSKPVFALKPSIPSDMASIYSGYAKHDASVYSKIYTQSAQPLNITYKKLFVIEKKGQGKFSKLQSTFSDPSCYNPHLNIIKTTASPILDVLFCPNVSDNSSKVIVSLTYQAQDMFYSTMYIQKTDLFTNTVRSINALPISAFEKSTLSTLVNTQIQQVTPYIHSLP
jgi:hypothetical protein